MSKSKKATRSSATASRPNVRTKAKEGAKKSVKRAMARGKIAQAREALDSEFMALREINAKPTNSKQLHIEEHAVDDLASVMDAL